MAARSRCPVRGIALAAMLLAVPAAAGVRVLEPATPREGPARFEIGLSTALSSPTGLAGDALDPTVEMGLTTTAMQSRFLGVGAELSYARWASPPAGAELDQLLTVFGHGTIRGIEVELGRIRAGGHIRLVPLPGARITPWIQAGVGINRLSTSIRFPIDQMIAAGWTGTIGGGRSKGQLEPDFTSRVGFDLRAGSSMRVGVDASYQWMSEIGTSGVFTAFTLGGHVTFGQW